MKAKLTREQLIAAVLAGLFGHLLIAIGWWSFGMLIVAALIVLVLGMLLSLLFGGANPIDLLGEGADSAGALIVVGAVIALFVGAVVLFLGIIVSRGILRGGRVRRPVAVTIRAALIAVAIDTVIFAIAASSAFTFTDADQAGPFIRSGILLLVSALVVGPLVWLCMTWAHRGLATEAIQPAPVAAAPPADPPLPGYTTAPPAEPGYSAAPPPPPAS